MAPDSVERVGRTSREAEAESRGAVVGQFEMFMERIIRDALGEFEPFRVVRMSGMPGNDQIKKALSPVIRDELKQYRANVERQFEVVMDYAETGNVEECADEFLCHDVFYTNFEGDPRRRRSLKQDLTRRMTTMGDDMAPLLRTGEEEFWDAVVEAYDEDEAREMLPRHFEYTENVKEYRDDLRLTVRVGSSLLGAEVEYTDEAMRVLNAAETRLRDDLRAKVGKVYG